MVEFGACFPKDKIDRITDKVMESQRYIKMLTSTDIDLPQRIDCMTIEDIKEGERLGGGHGEYIAPGTIKINPFMDDTGILLNYIHENIHHVLPNASENLVDHLTDLVAFQMKLQR